MDQPMMIPGPVVKRTAAARPKVGSAQFKSLVKPRLPSGGKPGHVKGTKAKPTPEVRNSAAKPAKHASHPVVPGMTPSPPVETSRHTVQRRSLAPGGAPAAGGAKPGMRPKRAHGATKVKSGAAAEKKPGVVMVGEGARSRALTKQVVSGKRTVRIGTGGKHPGVSKDGKKPLAPPLGNPKVTAKGTPMAPHRPVSGHVRAKMSAIERSNASTTKPSAKETPLKEKVGQLSRRQAAQFKPAKSSDAANTEPGTPVPSVARPVAHRISTAGVQPVGQSHAETLVPGWKIQAGRIAQQDGVKRSSWIIRPPISAGQAMKLELTQEGSKLKADLTVTPGQVASGLVNACPTALPHQAVHLPDGVSTLEFSLFTQGGNPAFSGHPGQSHGGRPYVPDFEKSGQPLPTVVSAGYGEGGSLVNGVDYRV